jgi:hypothetical protein
MTTKLIVLVLGCWPIAQVWADPPVLLRIIRNARDTGSRQIYAKAATAVNVLGMRTVSGLDVAWLIEMHDSFASIEGVDQAIASTHPARNLQGSAYPAPDDALGPARLLIALYRPGLSYRPDEAAKSLPRARYMLVSIYQIRPGNETAFAEIVKLRRAVNDSINLNRPEIAYEVVAGTLSRTYVFVTPLLTLKTLDDGLTRTPTYAEGIRNESKKAVAEAEISQERMLLRIDPGLSYVSDEFASADTEFWKPK